MARRGFRKAICFFQHAFVLGTSEVSVRREKTYSCVRALEEGLHLDPLLLLKFLLQLAVLVVLMQGSRDTQVRGGESSSSSSEFEICPSACKDEEWNPDQSRLNTTRRAERMKKFVEKKPTTSDDRMIH
ncbi:hypothetical protein GBA52_028761 [Prunus armeniaca]|nr:hypothetical protein GBA52_028761 [Prunus armeniaca]